MVTHQLASAIGYLTELQWAGFPVLDLLHAVLIAYIYRSALAEHHSRIGWGQGLVATIVMAAGGGSTIAIIRGEPVGILKSNEFWIMYGAAYAIMFAHTFVYEAFKFLFSIPLVEEVFTVVDAILRNIAIVRFGVDGVDDALGPGKWVAKLICGTLAGAGGGFWIDSFQLTHHHWSFSTPRWLHEATIDVKASFVTALFYMLATNEAFSQWSGFPLLSREDAETWSAVVLSIGLVYGVIIARQRKRQEQKEAKQKQQ
ncbi:hypothetical protein RO3G_16174 [Lichtheimia corymbifera JMRC:FSU:9682]|uniref:Uncharacterized protein n=1 Tax=Lichtheimia corymbifera JMRC:FSU:9682 TaxID=1263082 RepID=A0A068RS82_9FUNG|nr:hypothetical protein RO3G_16174 [Lichtheimia corymbifera JMRC:FSU:9682]